MSISHPVDSSLSVECPHCGHAEADDFEALDDNQLLDLRCSHCGQSFHIAVMECPVCAAECLFSWSQRPTAEALKHLTCETCYAPYRNQDADPPSPRLRA